MCLILSPQPPVSLLCAKMALVHSGCRASHQQSPGKHCKGPVHLVHSTKHITAEETEAQARSETWPGHLWGGGRDLVPVLMPQSVSAVTHRLPG